MVCAALKYFCAALNYFCAAQKGFFSSVITNDIDIGWFVEESFEELVILKYENVVCVSYGYNLHQRYC